MFSLFKTQSFARDVSILASGTAFAQVISFLLYPIIGRLYTPGDMATFAVFTSLFTVCQVLSTGKYETSIFLAKSDKDAANIVALVLFLCVSFCLIITMAITLFADEINNLLNVNLGYLLLLVPLSIISLTAFDTYNEWCIRKKYFSKLSINKISNSVLVNGGKVGFAYTPFCSYGLVWGDVLGRFGSALICALRMWITDREVFRAVNVIEVKKQAKEFDRFPKYQMPSQFLNTLGASVPVLLLNSFYNNTEVGQFSMALAILSVPIGVIGRSIRDVSRKKIKDSIGNNNIHYLFVSLLRKSIAVSVVVALSVVYFLPPLFSFVLGGQWEQSGVFAQIMTPMFVASFVSTCVESPIIVAMKLKVAFIWQVLFSLCNIIPIVVGILCNFSINLTLAVYSASLVFCFMVLISISNHCSKILDRAGFDNL